MQEEKKTGIAGGIMVCHPPLIVPAVGKGEEKRIDEIVKAYQSAAKTVADLHPDTVVIVSPHAPSYLDYIQLTAPAVSKGTLRDFGDYTDRFEIHNDLPLVKEMSRLADKEGLAMGTLGSQTGDLDHGTMVPLYFLSNLNPETKIVRMSIGGLSNLDHYKAGELIAKAAENLGRRVAIVASGDLSHCQKAGTHYGYKPCGPKYDEAIMDIMGRGDFVSLVEMPEKTAEEAMSCGHKPFCVMAGAFDGQSVDAKALAHSAEFGVGYGIATYTNLKDDPSRHFEQKIKADIKAAREAARAREDAWISLARKAIEEYVLHHDVLPLPDSLPDELLHRKAGAFVSIHENGALRGCIGTTAPTQTNLGLEIIANAISACSHDPRFMPVRKDELDALEIHVDVLHEPHPCTYEDLDPKRYGVIVSSKGRRGLLLPDLEGVDTVEQQVQIAKQKAGIPANETNVSYERFVVERHE